VTVHRSAQSRLILASASPRRRELLSLLRIPFDVRPADIDEELAPNAKPEIEVRRLARAKAESLRLLDLESPIISADTIVVLGDEILGKPTTADEAREMLTLLRGRKHRVFTGVVLMPAGARGIFARQPTTDVLMRDFSDAEIDASIQRGDAYDKAGAYGIQDNLLQPVESYEGCYCNVVGLPLWTTIGLLRKSGFDTSAIAATDLLPQCTACPLAGER